MKLQKTSLAEQCYLELTRRIVTGELSGGTRLTEEGVSREVGISRTPVREALRRLAAEGLVEMLPPRGFRVAGFDRIALRELFECRAMIEAAALERALPRLPEEPLAALRNRLAEADSGELERVSLEVDEAMHELIAQYCDNRFLAEIARGLVRRSAPFRALRNHGDAKIPLQERLALLDALLKRDSGKAASLLTAHIRNGGAVGQ